MRRYRDAVMAMVLGMGLLAGSTVVATLAALTSTDDLSDTGTIEFVTDESPAALGETLKLRFYMSAGDYRAHPLLDNVRLSAEPLPPPGSLFMFR